MNLDQYILKNEEPLCDKILEFYSFLLRYHREIDQSDFSSNPVVLKKLKRYEEFKSWSELEELSMQQEKFDKYVKEWGSLPRVGKEQQPPVDPRSADYISKAVFAHELEAL
jgi:hypothetical protein